MAESGTLGDLLRRYRLAAGLSQEALAERAGLSEAGIGALERGRRTAPRPETLALLAQGLDLSAQEREALIAAAHGFDAVPPASEAPTAGAVLPPPSTLSAPPTVLVGRERDEAAVLHLLKRPGGVGKARLLTLVGPGGVGKTRLALAVATALQEEFAYQVYCVGLAAVHDPSTVISTLAQTMGLREAGSQSTLALIASQLADRRVLVVLDNLEQALDVAPMLGDLLARCRGLVVLATSRIPLRLRIEQRYHVPPLAIPPRGPLPNLETIAGYGSVQLFVERAQAIHPSFSLTNDNAESLARICQRLDGLPLAIELAAVRISLIPPAMLLQRLERRLPVLTGGARDLPLRQRTMRAAIAWSYDQLDGAEQALFRRLGVFSGSCALQAVETVCGMGDATSLLDLLSSLVEKSLVSTIELHGSTRIQLLETLREYAGEQLEAAQEWPRLAQAHSAYYVSRAEAAEPQLRNGAQVEWLWRLDDDHDNFRAVLQRTLQQGQFELGLRLGGALWRFWYMRGYINEGRRWLTHLLAVPTETAASDLAQLRASVLSGAGTFAELQGDHSGAQTLFEQSLSLARAHTQQAAVAASLNGLGVVADSQGDLERAQALFTEARLLYQDLADDWGSALVLSNMGYLAAEQGAYTQASSLLAESLTLFQGVDDVRNIAFSSNTLGEVVCEQGDYARARSLCEESLAKRRALGDVWGMAISLAGLGTVASATGAYAEAAALYEESLDLFRNQGARWNVASTLDSLSITARQQGDFSRAARCSEESLAVFRSLQDTKGMARACASLARALSAQQEMSRADALFGESLTLYRRKVGVPGATLCVEGLATHLCAAGERSSRERVALGVRLWAATTAQRARLGTARHSGDRTACAEALAAAKERFGAAEYSAAWEEGSNLTLEQALDEALASVSG